MTLKALRNEDYRITDSLRGWKIEIFLKLELVYGYETTMERRLLKIVMKRGWHSVGVTRRNGATEVTFCTESVVPDDPPF